MDEEVIIRPNIKKRHFTDAKVLCVDGIAIDENGFVLDESLGKVEDIRKLPRKGGCGIGSDGLSFEQVLDNLDRKALKEQEERRAAEQKAQEERLKQEEQEINRLRSLSEKDLLVELVLLLKNQNQKQIQPTIYNNWKKLTTYSEEAKTLSGLK